MQWEQRPVGPSCLPAEPDELISKQNSQDSVKEFVIWLITMKCQMILIMRIEILEIHFYSVVLKMFENLYSIVCIMSAFPPFIFMLIFFFFLPPVVKTVDYYSRHSLYALITMVEIHQTAVDLEAEQWVQALLSVGVNGPLECQFFNLYNGDNTSPN